MGMTWLTAEWFMISRHDPSDHNVLYCILHHYTSLYIILHVLILYSLLRCIETYWARRATAEAEFDHVVI